ncbi:MAG: dihydroorotase [Methanoregula sp.]|nr:dihydroorotase [Methanoregula sp.]
MESRPDLVLANVLLPGGRKVDISVRDGHVVHAGAPLPAERVIDCTGQFVLPGAVDVHVHMRGGPQSAKEDWETGSRSALAGGVTVVVDQPNTVPPLTDPAAFSRRVADAQAHSLCSFAINSAVTPKTPIEAMWGAGAMAFGETFFAPSSYGEALSAPDLSLLLGRIHALGGLATIHAESVLPGEDTGLAAHDALRSPEGERDAVLAVQACNTTGCRLHFCHMSSALSVAAVKGTVEVTPHHLFLSRERARDNDTRFKVNPPVRSERERKALFACWDRIDVIASDHAPHTMTEKAQEFSIAPSGVPGVETMVPLQMAEVLEKRLPLTDVIQKTSTAPAALIGSPPAGFVPGDRADFAIYPKKAVTIEPDLLHSKCGWTPYEGMKAVFPAIVIRDGAVVYEDGGFTRIPPVWYAGRGYFTDPAPSKR